MWVIRAEITSAPKSGSCCIPGQSQHCTGVVGSARTAGQFGRQIEAPLKVWPLFGTEAQLWGMSSEAFWTVCLNMSITCLCLFLCVHLWPCMYLCGVCLAMCLVFCECSHTRRDTEWHVCVCVCVCVCVWEKERERERKREIFFRWVSSF